MPRLVAMLTFVGAEVFATLVCVAGFEGRGGESGAVAERKPGCRSIAFEHLDTAWLLFAMPELLPGTEVTARGLRWELVSRPVCC